MIELALEILLDGDPEALWSVGLQRECLRMFRLTGNQILRPVLGRLVTRILAGPPRAMYGEISETDWKYVRDRSIWLRLAKLGDSTTTLPQVALDLLGELEKEYGWKTASDNRDEFTTWTESHWGSKEPPSTELKGAPVTIAERLQTANLTEALLVEWRELCGREPKIGWTVLSALAERDEFDCYVWRNALAGFSDTVESTPELWYDVSNVLSRASTKLFDANTHAIAVWIRSCPNTPDASVDPLFWDLWDRCWQSASADVRTDEFPEVLMAAINNAAGILAEAVLRGLLSRRPGVGAGLSDEFRDRLTRISMAPGRVAMLGRVILASRLVPLHGIDPAWTRERLLPRMNWDTSEEAASLWEGYAWSSRVTVPLLADFRGQLLNAVRFSDRLPLEARRNVRTLFVHVGVGAADAFTEPEQRSALAALSPTALRDIVFAIRSMVQDNDQRQVLWKTTLLPWFRAVWPKDVGHRASDLSSDLANVLTLAGDTFPDAVSALAPLLVSGAECDVVVDDLLSVDLPERYPEAVLTLLAAVIDPQVPDYCVQLDKLLDRLTAADSSICQRPDFRKLERAS